MPNVAGVPDYGIFQKGYVSVPYWEVLGLLNVLAELSLKLLIIFKCH